MQPPSLRNHGWSDVIADEDSAMTSGAKKAQEVTETTPRSRTETSELLPKSRVNCRWRCAWDSSLFQSTPYGVGPC